MELLLNLAWLLVVGGVVIATFVCPGRRTHSHSWHVVVVVIACIAMLLFPVISASDDLHPACDMSDEAAWRHDKRTFGVQLLALILLISVAPLLVLHSVLNREELALCVPCAGHLRLDFGRAPPVAF